MSKKTIIENHFFFEGHYDFQIRIEELKRLQQLRGVGPMVLYNRLARQEWEYDDVYEVIRLGLIGGGNPPKLAFDLAQAHVREGQLMECVPLAMAIIAVLLDAAMSDEEPEESEDEAEEDDVKKKD